MDNKANKALAALIAKALRVPKSAVSVTAGAKSRNKTVRVEGITPVEVAKALGLS